MGSSYLLATLIILGTASAVGVSVWATSSKNVEEQLTESQKKGKKECEAKNNSLKVVERQYWWIKGPGSGTCTPTPQTTLPSGLPTSPLVTESSQE